MINFPTAAAAALAVLLASGARERGFMVLAANDEGILRGPKEHDLVADGSEKIAVRRHGVDEEGEGEGRHLFEDATGASSSNQAKPVVTAGPHANSSAAIISEETRGEGGSVVAESLDSDGPFAESLVATAPEPADAPSDSHVAKTRDSSEPAGETHPPSIDNATDDRVGALVAEDFAPPASVAQPSIDASAVDVPSMNSTFILRGADIMSVALDDSVDTEGPTSNCTHNSTLNCTDSPTISPTPFPSRDSGRSRAITGKSSKSSTDSKSSGSKSTKSSKGSGSESSKGSKGSGSISSKSTKGSGSKSSKSTKGSGSKSSKGAKGSGSESSKASRSGRDVCASFTTKKSCAKDGEESCEWDRDDEICVGMKERVCADYRNKKSCDKADGVSCKWDRGDEICVDAEYDFRVKSVGEKVNALNGLVHSQTQLASAGCAETKISAMVFGCVLFVGIWNW